MIIRILGEGQLELADHHLSELNELDQALTDAANAADSTGFDQQLTMMLHRVRALGTPVAADRLATSDAILPPEGSSLEQVQDLLGEQGLIPG